MDDRIPPFLSALASAGEPWRSGAEAWWKSVEDGRRALERLSEQVTSAARRDPGASAEDLRRLLSAVDLLEIKVREARAESEQRIATLEAQVVELSGDVKVLAETVSALATLLGRNGSAP